MQFYSRQWNKKLISILISFHFFNVFRNFDQICFSLFSYWAIVRKRLRDHAHLLVMFSLCGKLRKWEELMDSLWRENSALYIRLLVENRDVAQRRTQLQNRIQRLQEASQVLNSITMEL